MWNIKSKPWDEGNGEYSNIEQKTGYDWVPDQAKELMAEMNLLVTYDQVVALEAKRRFQKAKADFARAFCRVMRGDYEIVEELENWLLVTSDIREDGTAFVFFVTKPEGVAV